MKIFFGKNSKCYQYTIPLHFVPNQYITSQQFLMKILVMKL
jgi:hypothetical protein